MTQEFVTLRRDVVEQMIENMKSIVGDSGYDRMLTKESEQILRAALEQPKNHIEQHLGMVPAGWKLAPVEPNCSMVLAGERSLEQHDFLRLDSAYRAMLAAAPQPPTTEQSSAVQQPQGEQEPVAWIRTEWSSRNVTFDGPPAVPSVRDELTKPVWTPLYTHQQNLNCKSTQARLAAMWGYIKEQPQREPLTHQQIDKINRSTAWPAGSLATLGDRQWLELFRYAARAIEAAHNIK